MLAVHSIDKTFAGGIDALKGVNLQVKEGEIVSLVGPSGCGKSTLLRLVAGLDAEYEGEIDLAEGAGRVPGFVFQEPRLMPWLSVRENVAFGLKHLTRAARSHVARAWLERVGLSGFADALPKALSGGMAQRVALARALATEPPLLLLDEPFSALDAFTKMRLQDELVGIWSRFGTTMLLVTHDVDEAVYLSDRVVVLSGRPGTVQAVFDIHVERPRQRSDERLARLRGEVLSALGLTRHHAESGVESGQGWDEDDIAGRLNAKPRMRALCCP